MVSTGQIHTMDSGSGEASSRTRHSDTASLRQCWIYLSGWAPYGSMQGCYYYFRHSNS
ncbi:hypothetical protein BS78_07G088900 [Paspalum vaginatum]|nr:hypothetical protein BS78_07G088900 [Paspalum vaginatum]